MRITAGLYGSRKLYVPEGQDVRPTTDKVRQAVFNSLAARYGLPDDDTVVLDVYCGSGSLGLEALSRGARAAVFIDKARPSLAAVKRNIDSLGVAGQARVLALDAARLGPRPADVAPATLLFMDPPYDKGLALPTLQGLVAGGWLAPGALCVVETERTAAPVQDAAFTQEDQRTYGRTHIVFYQYNEPAR